MTDRTNNALFPLFCHAAPSTIEMLCIAGILWTTMTDDKEKHIVLISIKEPWIFFLIAVIDTAQVKIRRIWNTSIVCVWWLKYIHRSVLWLKLINFQFNKFLSHLSDRFNTVSLWSKKKQKNRLFPNGNRAIRNTHQTENIIVHIS